jgi:hypothetical protein
MGSHPTFCRRGNGDPPVSAYSRVTSSRSKRTKRRREDPGIRKRFPERAKKEAGSVAMTELDAATTAIMDRPYLRRITFRRMNIHIRNIRIPHQAEATIGKNEPAMFLAMSHERVSRRNRPVGGVCSSRFLANGIRRSRRIPQDDFQEVG